MRNLILAYLLIIYLSECAVAQQAKDISQLEYQEACRNKVNFILEPKSLYTKNGVLYIKTKNGKQVYKNILVEEEHPDMRKYEIVGVNKGISKALIREIKLTETSFILVDLITGKEERLDSAPILSSSGKYLATISEPESDNYKGLKIYELTKNGLNIKFKDTNIHYYYSSNSGKWCDDNFYIIKKDMKTLEKQYLVLTF